MSDKLNKAWKLWESKSPKDVKEIKAFDKAEKTKGRNERMYLQGMLDKRSYNNESKPYNVKVLGVVNLTKKQDEIFYLYNDLGMKGLDIAKKIGISPSTVSFHIQSIKKKFKI